MSDCYVWFDPVEEIERWKRMYGWAREEGRREVMQSHARVADVEFKRAIQDCANHIAEKIGDRYFMASANHSEADYHEGQKRTSHARAAIDPFAHHIIDKADVEFMDDRIFSDAGREPRVHMKVSVPAFVENSVTVLHRTR